MTSQSASPGWMYLPIFIATSLIYAQAEYLQAEYERQKTLSTEQAASQKKFQQSKADYLSMKSKLEATAAQLTLLGIVPEELLKSGIQPLLSGFSSVASSAPYRTCCPGKSEVCFTTPPIVRATVA